MWPNDRTGLSKWKKPSIYCQQGKFNKLVTHSHLHSHSFTFLLTLTFTILAYSSKLALREPVMQSASINTDWSSIKKSNYIFICFCKKITIKVRFFLLNTNIVDCFVRFIASNVLVIVQNASWTTMMPFFLCPSFSSFYFASFARFFCYRFHLLPATS